jgi:hypothetical protein
VRGSAHAYPLKPTAQLGELRTGSITTRWFALQRAIWKRELVRSVRHSPLAGPIKRIATQAGHPSSVRMTWSLLLSCPRFAEAFP